MELEKKLLFQLLLFAEIRDVEIMILFAEEDMPWLDYLDEDGERDEYGNKPINDDAPSCSPDSSTNILSSFILSLNIKKAEG